MSCAHTVVFDQAGWTEPGPDADDACADCVALGEDVWSHLRLCLTCGHVACCDSSPHRHATAHARERDHPVMRSNEPGERWRWCVADERIV
ncbi:MAG: UBP-type zinc finger domain-containing protein [Pseudonocardia sp.]|nr:UBP-type zinc finger domain-containing protein [Pseudonocardia sp.]